MRDDGTRGQDRAWVCKENGLTLVELLIALTLSSLVISGIYTVYINQLNGAKAQEKIIAMRQNWRAGHYIIGRELMRAGYSAHIKNAIKPGFTRAEKSALAFTYVDDATENLVSIAFAFTDNDIVRTISGFSSPVAEDIEALEFIYQLKDGTTTWAPDSVNFDDIRAVRVTILARTAGSLGDYPNSDRYDLPFPDGETENTLSFSSDGIYRQLVTGFFNCRNMVGN